MSKRKVFVFGSNGSAIISALFHQSEGADVTLFDPGVHFDRENPKFFAPEIAFWPSSEVNFENLGWVEKLVNLELGGIEKDLPPIGFENNEPTPFIGFGEKKYTSLPAAASWNLRARLVVNDPSEKVYNRALELFEGTIKQYSEISKVNLNGDGIESVEINGGKELKADHYVFAQSPLELLELFPEEAISARVRTRIARTQHYSRVSLALDLPESFESEFSQNLMFLLPNQNDQQPAMGLMGPGISVWQSFLPGEQAEDPEALATLIRNMKKLIGKSIPTLTDFIGAAGIHVQREAYAEYNRDEAWDDFKKHNNNASLVSPIWSSQHGLAACVEACQAAAESSCREASNLLETSP